MACRGGPLTDHTAAEQGLQEGEQEAWDAFRAKYPARFARQQLRHLNEKRPYRSCQRDWTVYTHMVQNGSKKIKQRHLLVPSLVPTGHPTPPIEGFPGTVPFRANRMEEHVTNIYRMEALLKKHPQVDKDRVTRIDKAVARRQLEAGRPRPLRPPE